MKVVLIGGAGYIGRPLVQQLREKGIETISADIRAGDGVDEAVDMRSAGEVYRLLLRGKPDVVVVTAYMLSRASAAEPLRAVETNVLGLTNVFQAAVDMDVRRVVFASSGAIFGNTEDFPLQPVDESVDCRPRILYAKMKRFNEWMAEHFNESFGTEIVSYRISGPQGNRQASGGQSPYDKVVAAAGKRGRLTLPWTPHTLFRFIHIEDAASSFIPIVLAAQLRHRIYNAPGYAVSIAELAELARQIFNLEIEFAEPAQTIDFVARIDSTRYEREFEFRPRPMAEWMRKELESLPSVAPAGR